VRNVLLVCIGAIGTRVGKKNEGDHALFILEVDHCNNYSVKEIYDQFGERRKAGMPFITKVMYRDCGLILACFKGYVELLDRLDFQSKGVWDNSVAKKL
jgi:hypothetical protein